MDINTLELAARKAWPALEEQESELGVLRYAAGISRRANSLSPSPTGLRDPARLLQLSESWFYSRGLPSMVRIIDAGDDAAACRLQLDQSLAVAGYEQEAPTALMVRSLETRVGRRPESGEQVSLAGWLRAWHGIRNQSLNDVKILERMLGRIDAPHVYLQWRNSSAGIVATGMGVISGGWLGIFGIATAPGSRRQGLAAALIGQLVHWGSSNGATSVYLQVEQANRPAISLYHKLGFQQAYRYWFRRKAPVSGEEQTAATGQCLRRPYHSPGPQRTQTTEQQPRL